jgi:hypothetical protein
MRLQLRRIILSNNTHPMKLPSALKSLFALAGLFVIACPIHAATYTTHITGTSTATQFELNYIEVVWTTDVNVGDAVTVSDLSGLSFSYYDNSDALAYTDTTIIDGVVQLIGGVARSVEFNAVSGVSISSFDNDFSQNQLEAAVGMTANLYWFSEGTTLNVAAYDDGVLIEDASLTDLNQITTTAIPEPSASALIAGMCSLALIAPRRRHSSR